MYLPTEVKYKGKNKSNRHPNTVEGTQVDDCSQLLPATAPCYTCLQHHKKMKFWKIEKKNLENLPFAMPIDFCL